MYIDMVREIGLEAGCEKGREKWFDLYNTAKIKYDKVEIISKEKEGNDSSNFDEKSYDDLKEELKESLDNKIRNYFNIGSFNALCELKENELSDLWKEFINKTVEKCSNEDRLYHLEANKYTGAADDKTTFYGYDKKTYNEVYQRLNTLYISKSMLR